MGLFKKIKKAVKGVRKALHLPAITLGNVAKVAGVAGTGGLGAGALALGSGVLKSKLKSAAVGGIKQVLRTKAEKTIAAKMSALSPLAVRDIRATTMPGGAPLRGMVSRVRTAARRVKRRKRPQKPQKRATSARKAPKGGLDLKAISARWKAAGKPGKWLDFVKASR